MREKVIVMGGGIIGLSCALELQRRGYQAVLLETKRCGGQASGAAAGMLAPYSENVEGPDSFFQLCRESLQLYPDWQQTVREISGQAFEYTESGSLYVAYHDADLLALAGRLLWQREYGSSGSIVEGAALHRMEPLLTRGARAALYTPEESHIYAPHYVQALEEACRRLGVCIYEDLVQLEIVEWQKEVIVRALDGRFFEGDQLLICSGAWAQQLADTFHINIPVYPIRGQICAYEVEAQPVSHMVFCNQGYLVGKANGTLVCGASEDVAGYDTAVTERGIGRLQNWNKQLFPFLADQTPFHSWAGLRPATQDGYPLIGPVPGTGRVVLAVGHYRNGILLSPATALLAADYIANKQHLAYSQAFSPNRFS
ncbi:glycine oxidase ThiO [Paenibacillus sinopodophylli]|uniref:glycine oxidase ThiO n=1 Tax=Paenibacillus sinopodophylli TaxID=1837342 RepID=UPI00110CCC7E|nr:glycine oxidase ThiO [Paenibacillus sinopodophylli]